MYVPSLNAMAMDLLLNIWAKQDMTILGKVVDPL